MEVAKMTRSLPDTNAGAGAEAQHLVCGFMVRACQQAIYDLALDDSRDEDVRHLAIQALREVLQDWRAARRALRIELAERRPTFTTR
jgi:hypothetical protein